MMILLFVLLVSVLVIVPQAYALGFSDIASVFSLIVDPVFSVFGVTGTSPVIVTAYLDKQKYMPGEQMTVTAAVEGAESVRAYIENDAGVDEVDMILITGNKEKGTWQCVWVLHDTVGDKEYKTRVAAISSGGLEVEKVLIWFDPNPGHSADEIGSGTMTGPIGIDGNLNVNEKVNAAEYCDENGANCNDASDGVGGGTAAFYESSGYESGINVHTYCINKGYSHAIMYEYWNGGWGSTDCCSIDNHHFHNTKIVLETDNPILKAGHTAQWYTGSGKTIWCDMTSHDGGPGGTAYYFKIICS